MTSDEIDRLEAGRDADTLLARLIPLPGVNLERVPWEPDRHEPYWRYVDAGFREQFRPTTDPAAAALVLGWLRAFLESKHAHGPDRQEECLAEASELAICKAALLALANDLFGPKAYHVNRPAAVPSLIDDIS
jgi:hypothetical protein